jgi:hypothetical protein
MTPRPGVPPEEAGVEVAAESSTGLKYGLMVLGLSSMLCTEVPIEAKMIVWSTGEKWRYHFTYSHTLYMMKKYSFPKVGQINLSV